MHTGSDILILKYFLYAAEILFDAVEISNLNSRISGFKVPYKRRYETDIEELGKTIKRFNAFALNTEKN
jgi:hypothetical protein